MWKRKLNNLNGGGYSELSGRKNRLFRMFNIVFLSAAVLCSAIFAFPFVGESALTQAFSSIPSATVENLYDKTSGRFNRANLNNLAVKIGYSDIEKMVEAAENSSTALKKGSDFGTMTVNLGSYTTKTGTTADLTWMPVYLARDDDGNAILTLWLALNETTNTSSDQEISKWSDGSYTASNVNPNCNNYGTSYIRAVTLNNGGSYATAYNGSNAPTMVTATPSTTNKFADFTVGNLKQYLTVPNKVAVQRTRTGDRNEYAYSETHYTNNWGNDPIWLPSRGEVLNPIGSTITFSPSTSQKANKTYTWLRSGGAGRYYDVIYIPSAGTYSGTNYYTNPTAVYGVRPCIHLNLTAVEANLTFKAPSDFTSVYNGNPQSVQSVMPAWANAKYNDASKVKVTYTKNSVAVAAADVIDAGEYEVKIELLNPSGTTLVWEDAAAGTEATDRTRTCKFTITKKPLAVTLTATVNNTTGVVTPNVSYTASEVYARDGTLAFDFTYTGKPLSSNSNPAAASYNSTTPPTVYGDYTVTVGIQNAALSNYSLTGTTSTDFTISKAKAQAPTITVANATKTYNATLQQVTLSNFDATKVTVSGLLKKDSSGSYVPTTDITWTSPNTYVEVKNAGEYRLEFSVLNGYEWADGSADSVKKTASFTVKPKELTVAVTNDEATNSWGWQGGSTITIKIAVSGVESGDNIAFDGFYYDNNTPATPVDKQAGVLNSTSGAYEATLVVSGTASTGTYTVNANLTAGVDQTDNYVLPSGTGAALPKSFTVLAQNVNVSLLSWQVVASNDPTSTPVAIAENGTVKYGLYDVGGTATPITYTVQLDTTNFTAMYLLIDTSTKPTGYTNNSGSAVNTYTTTVDIKAADSDHKILDSSNNPVSSITLTLHWEIVKGDFDLSGLVWEYVDTDGVTVNDYTRSLPYADGLVYTVRIKDSSLPVGLTLNSGYMGDGQYDIGTYTAAIQPGDVTYDAANFNAPDFTLMVCSWEITKKQIPLLWKTENHSNPVGKDYNIAVIDCDPALASNIGYRYYDNSTGALLPNGLDDIDAMAVGSARFTIKVEAYLISGTNEYMLGDGTTTNFSTTFNVGDGKTLVNVNILDKENAVYQAGTQHFLPANITVTEDGTNAAIFTNFYNIYYYTGTSADPANLLPAGTYPEAAGDYYVEIELTTAAALRYSLSKSGFALTVAKQKLAVPTFTATQFTGKDITLESCLTGYDANLMEIVGDATGRNARTYSAVIRLKDTDNYEWDTATVTPAPVSYVSRVTATINGTDCELDWNIEKAVVKADWKTDGEVPVITSLNAFKDLIDQQRLAVEYHYVDTATGEEVTTMEGGKSYEVRAVLVGEDAENIIFEDTQRTDTKMAGTFSAPQNGFIAAMGKIGSMLATNWWWILVALGILLFLIILIALIKRSKKKKEEKLAKKEAEEEKAEKKRRREEEEEEERQRRKRRREEEEEDERRRRKAQLEAQQQPAAQPQSNMMAQPQMQQMPMQQPMMMAQPAIVQQPQPQQQPKPAEKPKILIRSHSSESDERVKAAEERARRAEELLRKALDDRARNTVSQTQQPTNGFMQPQFNPYMQGQQPDFGNRFAPSNETKALQEEVARLKSEMQSMRSSSEMRATLDNEMAKYKASSEIEQLKVSAQNNHGNDLTAVLIGLVQSLVTARNTPAPSNEIDVNALSETIARKISEQTGIATPHREGHREVIPIEFKAIRTEEPPQPVGVPNFPVDGVMTTTTTTTVDTTKKKPPVRMREIYDTDEDSVNRK